MTFEHVALNVSEPLQVAEWYMQHLSMRAVRSMKTSPFTHFLADQTGRVVLEVYSNPKAVVPDYANRHPLEFHLAFAVKDAEASKRLLIQAKATLFEDLNLEDGSHLVMLRDPFGIPLQICQRNRPL
jgi:glyoxylase I family protein